MRCAARLSALLGRHQEAKELEAYGFWYEAEGPLILYAPPAPL